MNGTKKLEPITRDQEFYAAILDELRKIRLGLDALVSASGSGEMSCGECGRRFANARALAAHKCVHKEG